MVHGDSHATVPEAADGQNPVMYFGPVVYVLHVQLDDVEPPIWRRVVVEEATKLPREPEQVPRC